MGKRDGEEKQQLVLEISELREQLNQKRQFFMDIMESISEIVIIIDEKAKTYYYENQSAREEFSKHKWLKERLLQQLASDLRWNRRIQEIELSEENNSPYYYRLQSQRIIWENKKPAIFYMIWDITEEKRKEMNWEQNSYEDPLTHLYNRRYAMKTAQEWMERRQEFSFAFIDVDFLKYVNDEMGKLEGNRYLMRVANHLKQSSIPGVLCKTGGNEFMVLCPNVDETKLEHILEMCRETLAKEAKGSSIPYKMGFSYAVVTVDGSLGQDFSSYLETAYKKLYEYRKQRKKRL